MANIIDLHQYINTTEDDLESLEWITLVINNVKIIIPKEVLCKSSDYFKAMFGGFKESSQSEIEIDLSAYPCEKKHLELFFKKMIDFYLGKEAILNSVDDIKGYKIELLSSEKKCSIKYEYQGAYHEESYDTKIPLQQFYILSNMASYFQWNYYLDELTENVMVYFQYLRERLEKSSFASPLKHYNIVPSTLILTQTGNYQIDALEKRFDDKIREELRQRLITDLLNNFETIYLLCRDLKLVNELMRLFKDLEFLPTENKEQEKDILAEELDDDCEEPPKKKTSKKKDPEETPKTQYRSLEDIFDKLKVLFKDLEELITFYKLYIMKTKGKCEVTNVFDHYNDLKYKKSNDVYTVCFDQLPVPDKEPVFSGEIEFVKETSEPVNDYAEDDEDEEEKQLVAIQKTTSVPEFQPIIPEPKTFISQSIIDAISKPVQLKEGNHVIYTEQEFKNRFHEFTNNIFKDINWDGFIITGGFIYSTLIKIQDTFLPCTDIDLFVYGETKEARKTTVRYLLDFFEKHNVYFTVNRSVINIVRPNSRNIQIVCTDANNPKDIIDKFDASYVKLYYDGKSVLGSYDSLLSIRTQTTTFTGQTIYITRLYKALRKGLQLKLDHDKMYKSADVIIDKYIMVDRFGNHKRLFPLLVDNYTPTKTESEKEIMNKLMAHYKTPHVSRLYRECLPKIQYDAKFSEYHKDSAIGTMETFKNMPLNCFKCPNVYCFRLEHDFIIKMPYVKLQKLVRPNREYQTTHYTLLIDPKEHPGFTNKLKEISEIVQEKMMTSLTKLLDKKKFSLTFNFASPHKKTLKQGEEEDEDQAIYQKKKIYRDDEEDDIVKTSDTNNSKYYEYIYIMVNEKTKVMNDETMTLNDIKPGYFVKADLKLTKMYCSDPKKKYGGPQTSGYKLLVDKLYVQRHSLTL